MLTDGIAETNLEGKYTGQVYNMAVISRNFTLHSVLSVFYQEGQ